MRATVAHARRRPQVTRCARPVVLRSTSYLLTFPELKPNESTTSTNRMTRKVAKDERAPAFQFYWKQWLSDDNVLAMSWTARAMHMHFICLAWQQTPPCSIPDDDDIMRAWVGHPGDWENLKKQILRAWRHDELTGRWVQDGLLRVWQTQKAYRDSRRRNAKGYAHAHAEHMPGISKAQREHMGDSPSPSPSPINYKELIDRVANHFLARHPRRRIGPKDRKAVANALTLGYAAEDLIAAIDGNANDSWHRSKHKHELPYVLRDSGKIDTFRGLASAPQGVIGVIDGEMSPELERLTRPGA